MNIEREEENKIFHNVLSVMQEGELIVFQARLPKDREMLQWLWKQQDHGGEPAAPQTVGGRMKDLFDRQATLKREPFCEILGMTPQNWNKFTNGGYATTKREYIWRFAVLLRLAWCETCDLLRLDNELDMKKWDKRDRVIWKCLQGGVATPETVEQALREERLPPLYSSEAWELLSDPGRWAAAQKRKRPEEKRGNGA